MVEPRAFYRSYCDNGKRAGQVKRLHVVREHGRIAGLQGWCGIQATDVTNSRAVVLNVIPYVPPDGLTWCGSCVIALARSAQRARLDDGEAQMSTEETTAPCGECDGEGLIDVGPDEGCRDPECCSQFKTCPACRGGPLSSAVEREVPNA